MPESDFSLSVKESIASTIGGPSFWLFYWFLLGFAYIADSTEYTKSNDFLYMFFSMVTVVFLLNSAVFLFIIGAFGLDLSANAIGISFIGLLLFFVSFNYANKNEKVRLPLLVFWVIYYFVSMIISIIR